MQSGRWKLLPACGLFMGIAIGCHSFYPYPNGSYGYPGGYYPAPPTGPPASGTSPNLGPGSGSPAAPQSFSPQAPASRGTQGQWQQSPQSGSPQSWGNDTSPSGSADGQLGQPRSTDDNLVPDDEYGDAQRSPTDSSLNRNRNPQSSTSPFDEGSGADRGGDKFEGFASTEAARSSAPSAGPGPVPPRVRSAEPISVQAASQTRVVSAENVSGGGTSGNSVADEKVRPNPYGYDRKNYRWLRGVVDYEQTDDSWNIIYSLRPDPHDEFGGSIRLVGEEQLAGLSNEDIVLVEGHVDPKRPDSSGKPQYRVQHLARLVPDG